MISPPPARWSAHITFTAKEATEWSGAINRIIAANDCNGFFAKTETENDGTVHLYAITETPTYVVAPCLVIGWHPVAMEIAHEGNPYQDLRKFSELPRFAWMGPGDHAFTDAEMKEKGWVA